jgi:cyclic lactone autoinducer peptide
MFAFLASILDKAGSLAAGFGSQACVLWWVDEPECPKSLIK